MKYLQVDLVDQLVLQTQGNQWAPGDKDNIHRFTFLRVMQNCHFILLMYVVLQVHPVFLFRLSGQQHQLVPATQDVIIRNVFN